MKVVLKLMDKYSIKPIQLIHAMQNHDEITYELVHFTEHANDKFDFDGKEVTGKELRDTVVAQMHKLAAGHAAPYNKLSGNGLCTTYTGFCAAAFGIKDPYNMTEEEKEKVKRGHLLMALFNSMQPGVFAISGWDLTGALPLPTEEIKTLVAGGDYRWINRGAYDIMGVNSESDKSSEGMPKAMSLYGPLPEQLKDPDSFASRVKTMIDVRSQYGIALAERIDLPEVKSKGVVVMVHELPDNKGIQATAINFGREPVKELIDIKAAKGMSGKDLLTGNDAGKVYASGKYDLSLDALEGKVILFSKAPGNE